MIVDWSAAGDRRFSLLVNPSAGGGDAHRAAGVVEQHLHAAGAAVKVLAPTSVEQMRAWAEEAVGDAQRSADEGVPHGVVAVGGDGTVHTLLQAIRDTSVPFCVVASGSGDDAARAWGLPRGHAERAADILLTGQPESFDLAMATGPDGSRRYFGTIVAAGFDAKVSERALGMQRVPASIRYVAAVLAELRAFRPLHYRITLDGVTREVDGMLVSVANSRSFGGGMAACPDADPADGLFDVLVLDPLPTMEFLRVFPKVYRGMHLSHPAVHVQRAREVTVDSPDMVSFVDGERLGPLPQTMSLQPGALQVIVRRAEEGG